eukprot:5437864-Lingulodinium_polyedra.AAC.1
MGSQDTPRGAAADLLGTINVGGQGLEGGSARRCCTTRAPGRAQLGRVAERGEARLKGLRRCKMPPAD